MGRDSLDFISSYERWDLLKILSTWRFNLMDHILRYQTKLNAEWVVDEENAGGLGESVCKEQVSDGTGKTNLQTLNESSWFSRMYEHTWCNIVSKFFRIFGYFLKLVTWDNVLRYCSPMTLWYNKLRFAGD